MEHTLKLLNRIRDYNENAPDRRHHLIEPPARQLNYIATLAPDRLRPLSPMLQARFDYCGTWHDADLNQNWLSQTAIANYRNNPILSKWIELRSENWNWAPPGSVAPENCAVFGYSAHELEETYLVWEDGVEEPAIWRYSSAQYHRFDNLDRYLEYILGDRLDDDSGHVKQTYEAYLAQTQPSIATVARDYAALGVARPLLWAQSEELGENGYADCLFGYALRREVALADDHSWADAMAARELNIGNADLAAEAAHVLGELAARGIDLARLTPLVRAIQTHAVNNIVGVLNDGPASARLPLPNRREAQWGVYHVDADGKVGKPIGVRAVVNDPQPL